jgi:hypothetical protein
MLFSGKKPSISQKACWPETASRKVSPAVPWRAESAHAAPASGRTLARRARWVAAPGECGLDAVSNAVSNRRDRAACDGSRDALRIGRGGAKWR